MRQRQFRLNDTWAYDPAANTWTDLEPAGDLPSARCGHAMVYDLGQRPGDPLWGVAARRCQHCFNDTWAYDPAANTWTELHPAGDLPSARNGHAMVYDSATGKVILFGGSGGIGLPGRHLGLRPRRQHLDRAPPRR